jgi:hypothetical protein
MLNERRFSLNQAFGDSVADLSLRAQLNAAATKTQGMKYGLAHTYRIHIRCVPV